MDTGDFEGLDDLGRELRERVGGEYRRMAEDDEQAVRIAALRRRTLGRVAIELLNRGDTVVVSCGDQRIQGLVVHAGADLATIQTASGDITDVNLSGPVVLRVTVRATAGGRSRDRFGAETFLARLRELELEAARVTISSPGVRELAEGRIEAVASDHVLLIGEDGHEWYVPIGGIGTVARRSI